jgi:GNAT superfamily N-acetyltransferase
MLRLRTPHARELAGLSELCLRSKAVWGYDQAFLETCRAELTLSARDLATSHLQLAERDGAIVGVAQVAVDGGVARLEKLFIEPGAIRTGAGRSLFGWAAHTARALGATRMLIESDPDAAQFYRRMGAIDDGQAPSGSIPGRFLPRLRFAL